MNLGAFSTSLAVKDLKASEAFYEMLGFTPIGGDGEHYRIMKGPTAVIGLFQGMFEGNIMTFNPGWDENGETVEGHTDIREIQAKLKAAGAVFEKEADPDGTGPDSFTMLDPDGNTILVDQHI
ncbi:VOC family protein [Pacificimonas sp. WHA3]|uniref:VOC family protein n=1 Tax=Pacificimonas pallii TaxID=2827236 RepID=A0ABS6SFW7_9SPHN|nr:VOC family protein [Pacificimonas pallii]MBV7257299.1 VOC family protein [Pacificimonas pallii]